MPDCTAWTEDHEAALEYPVQIKRTWDECWNRLCPGTCFFFSSVEERCSEMTYLFNTVLQVRGLKLLYTDIHFMVSLLIAQTRVWPSQTPEAGWMWVARWCVPWWCPCWTYPLAARMWSTNFMTGYYANRYWSNSVLWVPGGPSLLFRLQFRKYFCVWVSLLLNMNA